MSVTRCTLATVRGRLISALNAATAATWTTTLSAADDNRRSSTELDNIILANDAQICIARASRYGDPYRHLFLALSASIAHGTLLPDCLGPPEQILIKYVSTDTEYKPGIFDPMLTVADINRWRANAGSRYGAAHDAANSVLSGFFRLLSKQLFYTGSDAKAYVATFTRSAACQAPEGDEDMLLGLSLGSAIKEGDTIGEGSLAPVISDARAEYATLFKPITIPEWMPMAA